MKTKLRIQKNKVKEVLHSAKKLYFTDYFTKHNSNAKKVWEGINLIIHTKSKKKQSINCLEVKNNGESKTITSPKEISNEANDYFTNIAKNILDQRKYNGNKNFKDFLVKKNQSKFKFTNTDPQQISSIIKSIDSSKAVGPNSIPPKVLNKIAPIISGVLAKIIKTSLNTAKFPTKMKICKINPIHKK